MRLLALLVASSACSSSAPAQVESQLQLTVTMPMYGAGPLACDSATSSITTALGPLQIGCNQRTGPNASMTVGFLAIASYHGSDTYTFTGSNDPMAGSLQFTWDNYQWSSVPASAGITATTCSATITAPAAPAKGDSVSGTFHCDAMLGTVVVGDGGYHAQPTSSVDGTFSGLDTL